MKLTTKATLTHVALGDGLYAVGSGAYRGVRAVFLEPVPAAGEVGARVPDGVVSDDDLNPGTIVITLACDASAGVLADAIAAAIRRPAAP